MTARDGGATSQEPGTKLTPGVDAGSNIGAEAGVDAGSITYRHVLIDFDDFAAGVDVTTQYADHVTLSSSVDCANQTVDSVQLDQSPPNLVTTYFRCDSGETAPIRLSE